MEGQEIRGLMEAYSQVYETPEILNEASAGEVFGRVVRGTGNALKDLPAATMAQLQGKGAVKANDEALARQQRRGQNLQTLVTTGRLPGQAPTSAAKPKLRNRLDDPIAGKGPKENEVGSKPALAPAAATTPPAAAAPATAPKPATAPAATTPPKQTIVLAKKDGVEGKLDKATGKFISGNFSDAEKARYAKFSKPTTPTSTNADKSTTPTNADKSTTPTNTDKSTTPTDTDKSTTPDGVRLTKINPEWAKAHPRLAEVERLRNQQRVAGKNPYDKEFRDKVINPVMYGYPNPKMPGSGRSVEDSKKMFPDTPKPAPTQTPAADAKPTPPAKPAPAQAPSGGAKPPTPKPVPAQKPGSPRGEDLFNHLDLFDLVKGHLLDEGYADTEQAAFAIMANMSEEWRQSIIEAVDDTHPGHPEYKGQSQDPLSRLNRTIGKGLRFVTGQRTAEVRAKQDGVPGNVFVKQSGPFSTKNVPVPGSFMSDTELKRRGLGTKPMGPIGE